MLQPNRETIWNSAQGTWSRLKGKHLFITGGTGFFGKSFLDLINYFNLKKNLNLKITILARNPEIFQHRFPDLINESWFQFTTGDIENFQFIQTQFDYILHFATPASAKLNEESPLEMFDIIYKGTRRVLEFAKYNKVQGLLLASSGATYGKQPSEMIHIPESYPGAPLVNNSSSAYGEAKRAAELIGNLYSDHCGFEHKIARCFAFVGPYLDPNGTFAIGNFIRDAVLGQDIIIKGDGTDHRSYMYSDDLILALLKILLFGKNKQPYNVGSDQSLSISEVAELVKSCVNKNIAIDIKKNPITGAEINRYVPSVCLLQEELQIAPSVSLSEAIIYTSLYYKKNLIL